MSRLQRSGLVNPRYVAVTTVLAGLCLPPAAPALAAGGGPRGRGGVPPPKVARCLAKPTERQRGACFRRTFGRHVPRRVARCLARRGEAQRSRCFRRTFGVAAGIPSAVQNCLAQGQSERASCFATTFGS